MKKHGVWSAILVLVLLVPWSMAQGGAAETPALPVAKASFLDYGYTGASTTDSLAIFDLGTWTLSGTLSLLPEGNYPYDATIKPDGSEAGSWAPRATG